MKSKKAPKEKSAEKSLSSPIEEAKASFDIGLKHRALKHHDEALVYFQQSLKLLLENNQIANDLTGQAIAMIGDAYDSVANAQPENLQYRIDSLTAMQSIFPGEHPNSAAQLARVLNNIGNQYLTLQNNAEALRYFSQSISTLKAKFPFGSHPYTKTIRDNVVKVCASICDLGNAHFSLAKYTESFTCFNQAVIALQNAFPEGHPLVPICRENITKIILQFHAMGTELIKANKTLEALEIFVAISDIMLQNMVKPASGLIVELQKLKASKGL